MLYIPVKNYKLQTNSNLYFKTQTRQLLMVFVSVIKWDENCFILQRYCAAIHLFVDERVSLLITFDIIGLFSLRWYLFTWGVTTCMFKIHV